jgi:hypothetical protein
MLGGVAEAVVICGHVTVGDDAEGMSGGRWFGCHNSVDATWIVVRGLLSGHNDTAFGWATPGRPIGRPGVAHPQAYLMFSVIIS